MISIWGSWLAFDAGTTLAFNLKSVMALCVMNLCAATGALTWMLYTYLEVGRWSLDSCFMGAISGLIMITPSAGFIDLPTAFFFGVLGALFCRQALRIKFSDFALRWRWVDHGDTFATRCLGGILATISTGCFARKEVAGYDGVTEIVGGVFFDRNVWQLGIQVMEALVGFSWSFIGSYVVYALIDCVPGFEVLAEDKYVKLTIGKTELTDHQGHHCRFRCKPNGRRDAMDRDAEVLSLCRPRRRASSRVIGGRFTVHIYVNWLFVGVENRYSKIEREQHPRDIPSLCFSKITISMISETTR
jgi:ammonia channel protein AmtB